MAAPEHIVAVVVAFEPETELTDRLLRALRPQVVEVVVVDNGSSLHRRDGLAAACRTNACHLVELGRNTGIAAAQNEGIAWARRAGADAVLLSDQDSLPAGDMVSRLVEGFAQAESRGARVGAVGPVPLDERQPDAALLFTDRRWGPRRISPPAPEDLAKVTFLLASGCLVPLSVLDAVGGMNEAWFIDHVDLEWGLRARQRGYSLFGVGSARLRHRLGDRTVRLPGRRAEVHVHGATRNYYMVRNTILLVRSGLLSAWWRVGYTFWITKYIVFYLTLAPERLRRGREMAQGVLHGLTRRTGPRVQST